MIGPVACVRSVFFHRGRDKSCRTLERRVPAFADYASRQRDALERLAGPYRHYTTEVSTGPSAISQELAAFLLVYCESARPQRILDLGSGLSSFVFRMYQAQSPPGVQVVSVDSDAAWLDKTRDYLDRSGLSTEGLWRWEEFERRPDGPFDLLLLDIRPIARRVEWLERLFASLAPGGALVIDDIHKPHLRYPLLQKTRRLRGEMLNLRHYTLDAHGRYAALLRRTVTQAEPPLGMTLLRVYLALLLRLCFDKKRHGQRISPWGRRLMTVLPKPAVRWHDGLAIQPHYLNRTWVLSSLHGTHEPGLERLITVAVRPGDTVVDVGAQVGLVTVPLARQVGASGRVLAFEPNPYNLSILKEVLVLNDLSNVTCLGQAAGSRDGQAAFGELTPAGYTLVPDHLRSEPSSSVEVVRLDRFLEQQGISRLDFLKIDVDGPDLDVLKGAEGLLRSSAPPLVTLEVSRYWQWFGDRFEDARQYLEERGYELLLGRRKDSNWEPLGAGEPLPEGLGERKGMALNVLAYRPDVHSGRLKGLV